MMGSSVAGAWKSLHTLNECRRIPINALLLVWLFRFSHERIWPLSRHVGDVVIPEAGLAEHKES